MGIAENYAYSNTSLKVLKIFLKSTMIFTNIGDSEIIYNLRLNIIPINEFMLQYKKQKKNCLLYMAHIECCGGLMHYLNGSP